MKIEAIELAPVPTLAITVSYEEAQLLNTLVRIARSEMKGTTRKDLRIFSTNLQTELTKFVSD